MILPLMLLLLASFQPRVFVSVVGHLCVLMFCSSEEGKKKTQKHKAPQYQTHQVVLCPEGSFILVQVIYKPNQMRLKEALSDA